MIIAVPMERRCAADAICLHDSTLSELWKKFCFRETKKRVFGILFKIFSRVLKNANGHAGTCFFYTTTEPNCLKSEMRPAQEHLV